MNRKVTPPILIAALVILGAVLFGLYRYSVASATPPENPGLADIPPRQPADAHPAKPPADAGPMPGTMPR